MAQHKEGKVENYFKAQVKAAGGLSRKARWLCRRGCPDQFWAFAGKRNGLAEIKPPGVPLKAHQAREIKRLHDAGVTVYVLDSEEAVDLFIKRETT